MKRCVLLLATSLPAFALAMLLFSGCDSSPAPTTKASTKSKEPAFQPTIPPPKPEVNFASVGEGVAAFKQACAERDDQAITDTMRWLSKQGEPAVAPLSSITNDTSADTGTRVASARLLALIGGDAATAQLAIAAKSDQAMLRNKVAESFGSMRPATPTMLDALLPMLDDKDPQVQLSAIRAVKRLGPAAKRAGPQLEAVLASDAPLQHRQEAKAALKVVSPRVGFTQGELDN